MGYHFPVQAVITKLSSILWSLMPWVAVHQPSGVAVAQIDRRMHKPSTVTLDANVKQRCNLYIAFTLLNFTAVKSTYLVDYLIDFK